MSETTGPEDRAQGPSLLLGPWPGQTSPLGCLSSSALLATPTSSPFLHLTPSYPCILLKTSQSHPRHVQLPVHSLPLESLLMPRFLPHPYSGACPSVQLPAPFHISIPRAHIYTQHPWKELGLEKKADAVRVAISWGQSMSPPGSSLASFCCAPSLLQLLEQGEAIASFKEYNLHKIVSKVIKGADSERKPVIKEFLHAFDIFPLATVSSS